MAELQVAVSKVSDGSMRNRNNPLDEAVIANRTKWLKDNGTDINHATRVQVTYFEPENDYCRYREVTRSDAGDGMSSGENHPSDALITTEPGVALFLPVADCVATTIYDEENGVLMLTHLGRQSLEQQGGYKSVQHLVDQYGSKSENVKVWLSPTVNKEVYPIHKLNGMGMKEAVYEQLDKAGVNQANIVDANADTATDLNYFSYSEFLKGNRSVDGCHAMVAMIKP